MGDRDVYIVREFNCGHFGTIDMLNNPKIKEILINTLQHFGVILYFLFKASCINSAPAHKSAYVWIGGRYT